MTDQAVTVAVSDGKVVVVLHNEFVISFPPSQARYLAELLLKHATLAELPKQP